MGYLIAAIAALLVFKSGLLTSVLTPLGITLPAALTNTTAPAAIVASNQVAVQQVAATATDVSATVQAATAGIGALTKSLGLIPVYGQIASAIVSVIASTLLAASKKRAQEATSENTAVGNFISPGYDQQITAVVNAYNGGNATPAQAIQLLQLIMTTYWSEVTPVIQPGRNGCQGGTATNPGYPASCSGSWGAACCVGYNDLQPGINACIAAINTTENTGAPTLALIPAVVASKYGGVNRPIYNVTWTRPA